MPVPPLTLAGHMTEGTPGYVRPSPKDTQKEAASDANPQEAQRRSITWASVPAEPPRATDIVTASMIMLSTPVA